MSDSYLLWYVFTRCNYQVDQVGKAERGAMNPSSSYGASASWLGLAIFQSLVVKLLRFMWIGLGSSTKL